MLNKLAALLLLLLTAAAVADWSPLQPPDTSGPQATMRSFLELADEVARRALAYRDSPSRETFDAISALRPKAAALFDLSEIPPAARSETGVETFLMLWDVLGRLDLPELHTIPDATAVLKDNNQHEPLRRWQIPDTEIVIVRVEEGSRAGEFLFSLETVRRMRSFYEQTRGVPYQRPMPIDDPYEYSQRITGWMIPPAWINALPDWTRIILLGQMLWKWFVVVLLYGVAASTVLWLYRWGRRGPWSGTLSAYLRYASAPLLILGLAPLLTYFTSYQINVTGVAAHAPDYLIAIAHGLAVIWLIWLTSGWIAELIINSPKVSSESLLAELIRLAARSIGIAAILVLTFRVAYQVGIPVYGLVTGAGVGGLALALVVRGTLENIMGTLNLYADRPVKTGDFCRYGEDPSPGWLRIGTVEKIGLRSTQIRGIDRTITTIPNAEFSNMHIVNLTARDRMVFRPTLALRYETTADQLRLLLVRLRELLLAHPRVTDDPARVRFAGLGEYSLNVEIFAYINTADWNEFLAIQEDIDLRIVDIVEEVGTGFAIPTRLYHARDTGIDEERRQAATQQVREWANTNNLPFPDFDEDYRKQITNTLIYPAKDSHTVGKG